MPLPRLILSLLLAVPLAAPAQTPAPTHPAHPARPTHSTHTPPTFPLSVFAPENQPAPPPPFFRLATVLPVEAPGLVGRAADSFHKGCLAGLSLENARLRVDLYPASDPASEVAAYDAAVSGGANFIAGPLSKTAVAAVLSRHPSAPVPTILMQPATGPASESESVDQSPDGYYVMTLDAAREAAALAKLLARSGATDAAMLAQQSPLARRQAAAFAAEWRRAVGTTPRRFVARAPPTLEREDLREMFERLKARTEADAEAENPSPPAPVFVAGDADFVRRARSYLPPRYPVYAGSAARADADRSADLQLEGLKILESPALANPAASGLDFAARPAAERRFFALGADACRVALRAREWRNENNGEGNNGRDGWEFNGAAGKFVLNGGDFQRFGILAEYRNGDLVPLSP